MRSCDHFDERGFSRAILPEQCMNLAGAEIE
jgi:hypothetical protein